MFYGGILQQAYTGGFVALVSSTSHSWQTEITKSVTAFGWKIFRKENFLINSCNLFFLRFCSWREYMVSST